jgi:hypothetical protein
LIRRIALIAALCLLASCGRGQTQSQAGGSAPRLAFPNIMVFRPTQSIPSTCDARSLAWLVGKSRTAIPVAADLDRRRVACTTCPVAADNQPDRTDILFDDKTGRITQVTCG